MVIQYTNLPNLKSVVLGFKVIYITHPNGGLRCVSYNLCATYKRKSKIKHSNRAITKYTTKIKNFHDLHIHVYAIIKLFQVKRK